MGKEGGDCSGNVRIHVVVDVPEEKIARIAVAEFLRTDCARDTGGEGFCEGFAGCRGDFGVAF